MNLHRVARVACNRTAWLAGALFLLSARPLMAGPSFPEVGPEPLGNVSFGAVVLHEGWQMRESVLAGDDGADISQPGFKTAGWYSTSVPATALGVLVRHGVYPDPYVGTNNMLIPDGSDDHNRRYRLGRFSHLPDKSNPWARPYWFRKEFLLPDPYAGKTVWLHLDGINYRADVWLNGRQVASAGHVAGMFKRFLFDVSSYVRKGRTNALAIRIHPLDFPGDPFHEQIGGVAGGFGPNGGDGEILRNVTEYCAIGWDWVPAARDRNMGLWQHVWLEATGPVVVRDPAAFVEMRLPGPKEAAVTVRCQLENPEMVDQAVELTARLAPDGFDGGAVEVHVNAVARAHRVTEVILKPAEHPELVLRNPRLWWPVTYGEQPLYRLVTEVRVHGQLSSQAVSHFGVRTVGSLVLPSGGRAFTANKARPRNSGTHLWKVNAAWPSMVWQVFDWYLRPNAGYYSMRSACRPLHVQHSVDDQAVQVVSTLPEPRLVRVRISLADAAGRPEKVVEHSLTAAADATTAVDPLPREVTDGRLHFLGLDLSDAGGRQLDRTVTWVQADCRWPELLSLPPVEIEAKVTRRRIEADESVYTVSVRNTSAVPVVHVWLEVLRGVQGEEVLPTFWSDNALNLLPGERRELTARFRTRVLGSLPPHLMVEGWNVLPRTSGY